MQAWRGACSRSLQHSINHDADLGQVGWFSGSVFRLLIVGLRQDGETSGLAIRAQTLLEPF